MTYYDIELIDSSDNVENFKFHKISKKDLTTILENFKKGESFFEFSSLEGAVLMKTESIRGIMHQSYEEKNKTVYQETMENAKEISTVKLKKTVFNSTGDTNDK